MSAIVILCSRAVLVVVLVPAVNAKLGQIQRVSAAVGKWRIVPRGLLVPATWALTLSELGVLLTVASGVGVRLGAGVALLLFVAIAAAAEAVVLRALATSCSCFSLDGTERVSHITALRAAALAFVALVIAWGSNWSIQPPPAWSAALMGFTIPLWLAVLRRAKTHHRIGVAPASRDRDAVRVAQQR